MVTNEEITQLAHLKEEFETIRRNEIDGILTRTKMKQIELGEKPTKYFLSLEKRNYTNKLISKLKLDNGKDIFKTCDILAEQKNTIQIYMQKQ